MRSIEEGYEYFIRKVSFPIFARRDGMPSLLEILTSLERSQYLPGEVLQDIQLKKIRSLLIHAFRNVEFYKKRFNEAGFDPYNFTYLDDLERIPILTKNDIRNNLPKLVATNFGAKEIHKDATGGSTGSHTPFYRNNACIQFKKAVEYRCNVWAGWKIGEKMAYYWPAVQDLVGKRTIKQKLKAALSDRSLMLYCGKLDEEILAKHYAELARFRPKLMRAFPNPLSVLAKYILEANKKRIHIPAIICVGEPLLENQRQLFSEVFGSKVYNCYVSRECGNMACECGERPGFLHINSEMLYVEYESCIDKNDCQPRKLLITDLVNYGMPFIRYRIEDMGSPVSGTCDCGRNLPLMRMEAGRVSEFIISPVDKSRISGASLLHHLIAEGPEVGQLQVVQDRFDHLRIKMLRGKLPNMEHFDMVIRKIFKGSMAYDIEYVDHIEHEPSGKYFFTKCMVSE